MPHDMQSAVDETDALLADRKARHGLNRPLQDAFESLAAEAAKRASLRSDITSLLNQHSVEGVFEMPDHVLADYVLGSLTLLAETLSRQARQARQAKGRRFPSEPGALQLDVALAELMDWWETARLVQKPPVLEVERRLDRLRAVWRDLQGRAPSPIPVEEAR